MARRSCGKSILCYIERLKVQLLRKSQLLGIRPKGKLRILQNHYQDLGKSSEDDVFDEEWRQEVENKAEECSNMSHSVDGDLDGEIEQAEIARCLRSLKNNKTGGSDGLVGELMKYGGMRMIDLLRQLFSVVWHEEIVPPQWREGLIVNLRRGIRRIRVITGA